MRLLLLAGLLALPLSAAWERIVATPKSFKVDQPEPHSLAYFTEYPMARDESGDFCPSCSPERKLAEAKKFNIKTELTLVGTPAGYSVYDLYYRFEGPGEVDTKSILVRTGADEYREIYHSEPTGVFARAEPSVLVPVGNDQFLEAGYFDGAKSVAYEYFWFDTHGATLVDFRPILVAAKSLIPAGRSVKWGYEMEGSFPGSHYLWDHTKPLLSRVSVTNIIDNKNPGPVTYYGIVEVEFKFEQGRVVVAKASYDPDAPVNE
jgi:hypothetical protein